MTNDLREWIVSMPKAEIHVHLEGTIGPSTLLELAARYDRLHFLPGDDEESIRSWMSFTSFPEFVGKYLLIASLLRTEDDFSAIVEACGKDMAQQGIRYREITLTPHLHCDFGEKRLPFETVIDGIEAGGKAFGETLGGAASEKVNKEIFGKGKKKSGGDDEDEKDEEDQPATGASGASSSGGSKKQPKSGGGDKPDGGSGGESAETSPETQDDQ